MRPVAAIGVVFLVVLVWCINGQPRGGGGGTPSPSDQIVHHARMAARLQNQGLKNEAALEVEKAHRAFQVAVDADANDPQPYLNIAVFQSNINRFTESLTNYKKALKLVKGNQQATAQISQSMKKAKYGYFSMKRDKAYKNGAGNVTKAYEWGLKQLTVSEIPELTNHQVATLEAMICDQDTAKCAQAANRFRAASALSCTKYKSHIENLRISDSEVHGEESCTTNECYLSGDWSKHSDIETKTISREHHGLYLYTTQNSVVGRGRDGVLAVHQSPDCSLLSPSSDHYLNLGENVLGGEDASIIKGEMDAAPVLSLVQFAGAAFYHWMAEAVPRLVIARRYWKDYKSKEMPPKILVPVPGPGAAAPGFVNATFKKLFADWEVEDGVKWSDRLIEYESGVLFSKGLASVGWGPQPCPMLSGAAGTDNDGEANAEEQSGPLPHCASLTHPQALREAREEIHTALAGDGVNPDRKGPFILLAKRGNKVGMRNYDEEGLTQAIISHVTSFTEKAFGIRTFDAADHTLPEALAMFRRASIIVGVHGGSLANIIACKPGTPLVEIGFNTTAARHYHHMANALGMPYFHIPLKGDHMNRALGAPVVDFDVTKVLKGLEQAMKAVAEAEGANTPPHPDL